MQIKNAKLNDAFFKHNYENIVDRDKVTRSSCIFYFINKKDISTELHFLNYWREKRKIKDITLKLTLRSMSGEIIGNLEEKIINRGAHVKKIKSILKHLKSNDEQGSIEMEFFSKEDFVIAYPAVIVRYVGENWHTSAHSSQRIFSKDSGDINELISGKLFVAEEGNLTSSDGECQPFFIIHNGPIKVPSHDLEHTITRSDGESKTFVQKNFNLNPYETKIIKPNKFFDIKTFVNSQHFCCKIRFKITGIFPRLISGFCKDNKWTIDHSNFASIDGQASKDTFKSNLDKNFKNLVFNFPINTKWNNYVNFPPTYPKGKSYKININEIDKKGKSIKNLTINCGRGSHESYFPTFDFSKQELQTNPQFIISHPEELPKRFHMILNYQIGDELPGFIVDGPDCPSTPKVRTRWLPCFGGDCENFIMISNRVIGNDNPTKITFEAKLFNSFNKEPLKEIILINPFESKCLMVKDIFKDASRFLRNENGWLYLIADKKQRCQIHYASVLSKKSIACDHGF